MSIQAPKRPDGSNPEALYAQFSHESISHVLRLQRVAGTGMRNTTQGLAVIPDQTSMASGAVVKMYLLRDVKGDYLVAHSWDGDTEGTQDIYIAKEPEHRESVTDETILGVDHTFTYSDGPSEDWDVETAARFNRVRHDNDGSTTEDQRIVPPWKDGLVIHAITARTDATRPTSDDDDTPIKIGLLII